jgi:hypothetical protein
LPSTNCRSCMKDFQTRTRAIRHLSYRDYPGKCLWQLEFTVDPITYSEAEELDKVEAERILKAHKAGGATQEARAPCIRKSGPKRDFRSLHFIKAAVAEAHLESSDTYDRFNMPRQRHSESLLQDLIIHLQAQYVADDFNQESLQDSLIHIVQTTNLDHDTTVDTARQFYQELEDVLARILNPDFTKIAYEAAGHLLEYLAPCQGSGAALPPQSQNHTKQDHKPAAKIHRPSIRCVDTELRNNWIGDSEHDVQFHKAATPVTISQAAAIQDITAFKTPTYYILIIGEAKDFIATILATASNCIPIYLEGESLYSDLCNKNAALHWEALTRAGYLIGIYAKPPSNTWCISLRTALYPWGKPGLSETQYKTVHKENLALLFSLRILIQIIATGGFAIIRHSSIPRRAEKEAALNKLAVVQWLLKVKAVKYHTISHAAHGGDKRFSSALTLRLPTLQNYIYKNQQGKGSVPSHETSINLAISRAVCDSVESQLDSRAETPPQEYQKAIDLHHVGYDPYTQSIIWPESNSDNTIIVPEAAAFEDSLQQQLNLEHWRQRDAINKHSSGLTSVEEGRAAAERRAGAILVFIGREAPTDMHIEEVMALWKCQRNSKRTNVIPDDQRWVHSDTLGYITPYGDQKDMHPLIISQATIGHEHFIQLLTRWIASKAPDSGLDHDFRFTSISINIGYAAKIHRDSNNLGPSLAIAGGQYKGGELCTWPRDNMQQPLTDFGIDQATHHNTYHQAVLFNGKQAHSVLPFEGQRWSLVFFTASGALQIDDSTRQAAEQQLHIPIPDRKTMRITTTATFNIIKERAVKI